LSGLLFGELKDGLDVVELSFDFNQDTAMKTLPSDANFPTSRHEKVASWLREFSTHLEPTARKAGRQISRAAAPVGAHIRKRPVAYIAGALLIGAGIGLLLSRSARQAVGDTLAKSWDVAGGGTQHAADTLRDLFRR
jgi:hypothetical protein